MYHLSHLFLLFCLFLTTPLPLSVLQRLHCGLKRCWSQWWCLKAPRWFFPATPHQDCLLRSPSGWTVVSTSYTHIHWVYFSLFVESLLTSTNDTKAIFDGAATFRSYNITHWDLNLTVEKCIFCYLRSSDWLYLPICMALCLQRPLSVMFYIVLLSPVFFSLSQQFKGDVSLLIYSVITLSFTGVFYNTELLNQCVYAFA